MYSSAGVRPGQDYYHHLLQNGIEGRVKQRTAKTVAHYTETIQQIRQRCLTAETLKSRICYCCSPLALISTPDGSHQLIVSIFLNVVYQTVLTPKQCLHLLPVTFYNRLIKTSTHTVSLSCQAHVMIK